MKDIADITGVSQATVSYVINNSKNISDGVKKKILDVAEDLGYIPNAVARNLKKSETNIIGVVVPDVMNSYYNEIIKHIEKLTREKGYFIYICYTMHESEIEDWYITSMIQQKVAGVIICYGLTNRDCYKKLYNHNIPVITIDDRTGKSEGEVSNILVNNIKGSFLAVQHFYSLGIKDICYISEPLYNIALRERYEGFLMAVKEFDIDLKPENIFIADKDKEYEKIDLGYTAVEEVLKRTNARGIFAANDQLAFGIIKRLKETGIDIPEDIAIIGYDNVPFSSVISPSLTTLNQPIELMCTRGIKKLFKIKKGVEKIKSRVMLEPSLIVRESAPYSYSVEKALSK
jgi:DNA-binding LacI/PurR family transcriptional regulator